MTAMIQYLTVITVTEDPTFDVFDRIRHRINTSHLIYHNTKGKHQKMYKHAANK